MLAACCLPVRIGGVGETREGGSSRDGDVDDGMPGPGATCAQGVGLYNLLA